MCYNEFTLAHEIFNLERSVIHIRLWSKDLIKYLPRQQLLSQWRECCCIAKNLASNGTPNHLLVNKILDYPLCHFTSYSNLVRQEMITRGYKINKLALDNYDDNIKCASLKLHNYSIGTNVPFDIIYKEWFDETYLVICLYNLYEKHQCQGVTVEEWDKIYSKYWKYMDYQ